MRSVAPLCSLSLLLLVVTPAFGQALYAGNTIAYQGRLELGPNPVNTTVTMTFRFYASGDETDDAELDSFTTDVTPASGKFAVNLGPLSDAVFAADDLWLSIEVDGVLLGGRQRVLPAARAARADRAKQLTVTGTAVVVGNTESNDLEIGHMGHAGWAGVAHTGAADPDSYALLQSSNGSETIVNAAPDGVVRIRTANTDRATVDSSGALAVTGDVRVGDDLDVAGEALLGYLQSSCDYPDGAQYGDCSCPVGYRVLSGGTNVSVPYTDGFNYISYSVRESRPVDERTWRVACIRDFYSGIGFQHTHAAPAATNCDDVQIICARIGN